jgi:hypothetical protein
MKTRLVFCLCLWALNFAAFGQHPLVGTWQMISLKGTNADGEKFSLDTTTVREIKIITPTHYMLIAHNVEGDSLIFNRSYAGTVRLEGNRYIETPLISSLPLFDNVKQNFTWKLDGNLFTQAGTFTRPDGKTIVLDELVFRKITSATTYHNNPAIGTWEQIESRDDDQSKQSGKPENIKSLHVVTPTHWMRITHREGKFESAMGGTYSIENNMIYPRINYASFQVDKNKMKISEKIEGNKLLINPGLNSEDKKSNRVDTFQRIK